ncbi:hypothetical protein PAL_GLEAN10012600 [Pteropus alecto]|uniref:Uncharacterized protein n=1 Tax=Pteropus alecto TaxID=9402 RepID=L5K6J1_PTEAL|nr:hypothetical protein PAL_GLEAN10012600 [Pteropus alecto]
MCQGPTGLSPPPGTLRNRERHPKVRVIVAADRVWVKPPGSAEGTGLGPAAAPPERLPLCAQLGVHGSLRSDLAPGTLEEDSALLPRQAGRLLDGRRMHFNLFQLDTKSPTLLEKLGHQA